MIGHCTRISFFLPNNTLQRAAFLPSGADVDSKKGVQTSKWNGPAGRKISTLETWKMAGQSVQKAEKFKKDLPNYISRRE